MSIGTSTAQFSDNLKAQPWLGIFYNFKIIDLFNCFFRPVIAIIAAQHINLNNNSTCGTIKMNTHFTPTIDSPLKANGRFGRMSYLGWNMLMSFVMIMVIGLLFAFTPGLLTDPYNMTGSSTPGTIAVALIVIAYIAMLYFTFVFTIRRLHDRNHSGWLSLIVLIPLVNVLMMLYLIFAKGDVNPNQYGVPRTTQTWEKVLAWFYILVFPIGIFAAISIPAYQDYVQRAQQVEMQQNMQDVEQ